MKRLAIIILSLLFLLEGCKEEKFQPYQNIPGLAITFPLDTTITLAQFQNLSIIPKVSGIESDREYSYEWRLYEKDSYRIISDKMEIDYPVELPIGEYTFQLQVTDLKTKIKAIGELYKLKVTGAFPEGWLVGNNVNGKGHMAFIRINDQQVFLNPLEEINNTKYPEKLVATIGAISPTVFFGSLDQILYFTENGMRVFDAASMLIRYDLNEFFYTPMSFKNIPAFGANSYHYDQYLIFDGNVHVGGMSPDPLTGVVTYSTFSDRLEGDYEMFPFVFNNTTTTAYFYDNKNKRFMSSPLQGRALTVVNNEMTNGQYNLNNINRTMIGSDKTLSNNFLSLMRDGNKAFIYAFRLSTSGATKGGYYTELSGVKELDQFTAFAAASDTERGYYSSKRNIYKVSAATGIVTEIYSFSEGSEIVDIKMLKFGDDANRQLVIAINKNGIGEVHCIYLNGFGDLDSTKAPKIYTGFGTITNLSFRQAS